MTRSEILGDISRFARPNRVEVDTDAIAHNVKAIRRFVGPATRIFAALKGNGYGFGLLRAAEKAREAGADALSVADFRDALELRRHGLRLPILVYGGNLTSSDLLEAAARHDIMPTLHDPDSAACAARHAGESVGVFVKVNVGLERFGFEPAEVGDLIAGLRGHPSVKVAGVYTHMHVPAVDRLDAYLAWQFQRFLDAVSAAEDAGAALAYRLASSSQVLALTERMNLNAVDPGHLIFGIDPGGPDKTGLDLRPALGGFKTALVHVRRLARDEFRDEAPVPVREGLRVGVIPIGYGDGIAQLHSGHVLVRGKRLAILGAHSAEHTRIDLSPVPEARVGDEVVIIGRQGDAAITLEDVIRHQGHPRHSNVMMAIPSSIPRVYVGGGDAGSRAKDGIATRTQRAVA